MVCGESFLSAVAFHVHLLGRFGQMKLGHLSMLELDLDSPLALPFLVRMAGIGAWGG